MKLQKRILRFVAGTVHYGLKLPYLVHLSPQSLEASVDADWGGCRETWKSTSGSIIGINKSPVVWKSRKQTIVATSSAESEYIALYDCVKQVSWIRKLF